MRKYYIKSSIHSWIIFKWKIGHTGLYSHLTGCLLLPQPSPMSPSPLLPLPPPPALCFASLSPSLFLFCVHCLWGLKALAFLPPTEFLRIYLFHKINSCTIHIPYFFHLAKTPKTIGIGCSRRVSFLECKSSSQVHSISVFGKQHDNFFFFFFLALTACLIILPLNFHICIINLAILCPGEFPPLNRLYSAFFFFFLKSLDCAEHQS